MTASREAQSLLPCPFCGGGEMNIKEYPLNNMPRMDGKPSAIISVEIRHWCEPMAGVVASSVMFRGRDMETAIAAWNRRTPEPSNGWRDIASAPRNGFFLIAYENGLVRAGHYLDHSHTRFPFEGVRPLYGSEPAGVKITHWMPLPAAPTGAGQ